MLVFLDESFRTNQNNQARFGVLSGVAIPEDTYHDFQREFFNVRRPYHDRVLKPDSEVKGKELLGSATLKQRRLRGASEHWDLAVKLLSLTCARNIKVFGIVCFRTGLHSFVCDNETVLDITYRYLFERIDAYMKREFPSRFAKLVFDNRDFDWIGQR